MRTVIFNDKTKEQKINNLVDYVERMSDVNVEVIEWKKEPTYLNPIGRYNDSFRYIASSIKDDFFLLEYDSVPLRVDWLFKINELWDSIKDSPLIALVTTDFIPPKHISSPIGVYKRNVREVIPQGMQTMRFDEFLIRSNRQRTECTGMIQYSPGVFTEKFNFIEHDLTVSDWMIREEACVFTSDPNHTYFNIYEENKSKLDKLL